MAHSEPIAVFWYEPSKPAGRKTTLLGVFSTQEEALDFERKYWKQLA